MSAFCSFSSALRASISFCCPCTVRCSLRNSFSNSYVCADADLAAARDSVAGCEAQSRVAVAANVAKKRQGTDAYVSYAGCQVNERLIAKRVVDDAASGTAEGTGKRLKTDRRIVTTLGGVGPIQEATGRAAKG